MSDLKKSQSTARRATDTVVWPIGVEERYGISRPTRWRWERTGKLPPRDVYVAGEAVGWRPSTLEAAERGPQAQESKQSTKARGSKRDAQEVSHA